LLHSEELPEVVVEVVLLVVGLGTGVDPQLLRAVLHRAYCDYELGKADATDSDDNHGG